MAYKKDNLAGGIFNLILLMLVLLSIDFFNLGLFIPSIIFFIVLILLLINKISKTFLSQVVALLLFSITFTVISINYQYIKSIDLLLATLIGPSSLYMAGYFINFKNKKSKSFIINIMTIIISSMTLFAFLSFLRTIMMYGSIGAAQAITGYRAVNNIWTGDLITATGINTYFSLGLSISPFIFYKNNKIPKYIRSLFLINFIISLLCTIALGNRTGILIIMTSWIIFLLFSSKLSAGKKILTMIFFFLIFLTIYGNIFGIFDYISQTTLGERFLVQGTDSDPRIDAWLMTIENMNQHYIGGREVNLRLRYSHNMWLDVWRDTGIIPFIFLMIFTIYSLILLVMTFKKDIFSSFWICLYSSFFTVFMLEPIFQGRITIFLIFCFVVGVIQFQMDKGVKPKVYNN